jgi:hypothetical protein
MMMPKYKLRKPPNRQIEMSIIMVGQWTDDRLKKAEAIDLVKAYGIEVVQAEKILDMEMRKRKWK